VTIISYSKTTAEASSRGGSQESTSQQRTPRMNSVANLVHSELNTIARHLTIAKRNIRSCRSTSEAYKSYMCDRLDEDYSRAIMVADKLI